MSVVIKFGTDGWRATPSTGLNEESIKICAQSFADYINNNFLRGQCLVRLATWVKVRKP